nr:4-diphosphocytidyl-2-C-methyl-D-erythritol kinase, chloroplastic/chromoplastic [Ipomoea trifida]
MSSPASLCTSQLYNPLNANTKNRFLTRPQIGSSSYFHKKSQFQKTLVVRATAPDSRATRKQVELVYDLEEKFNKLADEVDRQAGLSRLTLFSPCKVNIFLRITGRREDGFHDLASLFHIIKALNLYRKKTGTDKHFWIHLDKKVPTGAGLGGGSSNAATALWAANQFSDGLATEEDLQEWSSEIGSDVPFFFSHGAAYCTGRGEVVQDISFPMPLDIPMVLIKPPEACSTAEVYKRLQLDKSSKVDPSILLDKILKNGVSQDVCVNDLEPPAFEVLPSLRRLKQRIAAASRGQYDAIFMSGSGSTIVGIGSPDPPQFLYDEEEYKEVFLSEASFITRAPNQWYTESVSVNPSNSPTE